MTRAIDDTTSSCGSCAYYDRHAPGLKQGTGYCGYMSVPAWVHKHLAPRDDHRVVESGEGINCWQHDKRAAQQIQIRLNGVKVQVDDEETISFDKLCELVGMSPKSTPSITWCDAGGNVSGCVLPGKSAPLAIDNIYNVYVTGNA